MFELTMILHLKGYSFHIMVWGFKSCNFVLSSNARPFVLRFWSFEFPSRCHLELREKLCKKKVATKESSVPKALPSSRNIRVIISQNHTRMRCMQLGEDWFKRFQSLLGGSLRTARLPHDQRKRSSVHICCRLAER